MIIKLQYRVIDKASNIYIYYVTALNKIHRMEEIRCNICDIDIDVNMVNEHSSVYVHISKRSELERTLEITRRNSLHRHNNDSVISHWQKANDN